MSTAITVHEGGDRNIFSSFRLVSLTCIVMEALERILRDRIINYLGAKKLVRVEQHGFWHKRSCLTNSISLLDQITGRIDWGKRVGV